MKVPPIGQILGHCPLSAKCTRLSDRLAIHVSILLTSLIWCTTNIRMIHELGASQQKTPVYLFAVALCRVHGAYAKDWRLRCDLDHRRPPWMR